MSAVSASSLTPLGRIRQWLSRPHLPVNGVLQLDRRRLYILPTLHGLAFAVLLLTMLLTALNYMLNLGLLLTFALTGLGFAVMWHAYRNLLGVELRAGEAEPVFLGQTAWLPVELSIPAGYARFGLELHCHDQHAPAVDLPAGGSVHSLLPWQPVRRGWITLPRQTITSRFPLALFRCWSYSDLPLRVLVYPQPEADAPAAPASTQPDEQSSASRLDDDHPDQLRPYRPGDPLRSIAWKHSARLDSWLTRVGQQGERLERWLDWHTLPAGLSDEARLSRLTRWVLRAEQEEIDYGLRLPGQEVPLGHGPAQLRQCLEALASWGQP